jgi:hypothetical protein
MENTDMAKHELYQKAEDLVAKLVECRNNPRELSLTELYETYGVIADALNGQVFNFDNYLRMAAEDAGLSKRLAEQLPEFFDHGYKTVVESVMGDVKHAYDASNPEHAIEYLDKITGKHQPEGFKPLETGVIPGVNTTMTFKPEYVAKAMKQLEELFNEEPVSETERKKKLSETSRIAKFDDMPDKPKNDDKSNPAKGALTSILMG